MVRIGLSFGAACFVIALLPADETGAFSPPDGFTRRPGPGYGPTVMRTVGQTGD